MLVLKLGGVVIVLDTLPEIAGAELFNASPTTLETEEAGSVSESGVEYVVGLALIAMAEAIGEELKVDEEENNKFEVACLPMPLLGDCNCGVPGDSTASPARVELANGSNRIKIRKKKIFNYYGLMAYQIVVSSCHDAIVNHW